MSEWREFVRVYGNANHRILVKKEEVCCVFEEFVYDPADGENTNKTVCSIDTKNGTYTVQEKYEDVIAWLRAD